MLPCRTLRVHGCDVIGMLKMVKGRQADHTVPKTVQTVAFSQLCWAPAPQPPPQAIIISCTRSKSSPLLPIAAMNDGGLHGKEITMDNLGGDGGGGSSGEKGSPWSTEEREAAVVAAVEKV